MDLAGMATCWLFAKDSIWREILRVFGDEHYKDSYYGAGFVFGSITLVIIIGLVSRYANRFERAETFESLPELFRALCRAHRLDRGQRRVLKRLASFWNLVSPAQLFVQPDCFELKNLPPEWQSERLRLAALQQRLFTTE